MAARSSNLEDQASGVNLQADSHTDTTPKTIQEPQDEGALVSPPPCSLSWSPARRPLPDHPNTKYGLGIHVLLTEEVGAVTSPSYAWTAPLVEDMLCYAQTALTEAMVVGSGRAILFMGDN